MSFLADHFYPWLLIFVPFYKIIITPVWLFIAQALLACSMILPILILVKEKLGEKAVFYSSLLLFFYLPFRLFSHDFHGDLWQAAALSWIIYLIEKNKYKYTYLLILIFPLFKETGIVLLCSVGLYLFLIKKKYVQGFIVALYGAIASLLIMGFVMPWIASMTGSGFVKTAVFANQYYGYLGEGLIGKIVTLLTNPILIIKNIFSASDIAYLILLFAPLGFLSLFSGTILLAAGPLLQNLLSADLDFVNITAHYSIVFIPIVFYSAIFGYIKLKKKLVKSKWRFLLKGCIAFFIVLNIIYILLFEIRSFVPPKNLTSHYSILTLIPIESSVAADTHIQGHLQYRKELYRLGEAPDNVEYVVIKKYHYLEEGEASLLIKKDFFFVFGKLLLGDVRRQSDIDKNNSILSSYMENEDYTMVNDSNIWLFKYNK